MRAYGKVPYTLTLLYEPESAVYTDEVEVTVEDEFQSVAQFYLVVTSVGQFDFGHVVPAVIIGHVGHDFFGNQRGGYGIGAVAVYLNPLAVSIECDADVFTQFHFVCYFPVIGLFLYGYNLVYIEMSREGFLSFGGKLLKRYAAVIVIVSVVCAYEVEVLVEEQVDTVAKLDFVCAVSFLSYP